MAAARAEATADSAQAPQHPPKPSRHAHLASSAFDFLQIIQNCKLTLRKLLDKPVEGTKSLVLEPSLAAQLTLLLEATELRTWGFTEWHPLGKDPSEILPSPPPVARGKGKKPRGDTHQQQPPHTTFILLRCGANATRKLAQHLPAFMAPDRSNVVVGVVPRPTEETLQLLLHLGGFRASSWLKQNRFVILPVPLYLLPLDVDLLSMEIPDVFVSFHAIKTPVCLNICAEGLLHLQRQLGGLIPRLWCAGSAAKYVCSQLLRFRRELQLQLARVPEVPTEMPIAMPNEVPPQPPFHVEAQDCSSDDESGEHRQHATNAPFDRFNETAEDLVILDRRVDLVTPLCTPFSYEAMLDNVKGIRHGALKEPQTQSQGQAPKLNGSDAVFQRIRYMTQGEVAATLHERAMTIKETYRAKEQLQSIEEIGQFLHVFKSSHSEHASLALHVNMLQEISKVVASSDFQDRVSLEDEIMGASQSVDSVHKALEALAENEEDPEEVYRLLCLFHLTAGGLKPAFLEPLRKIIVENFGVKELVRMERLALSSLLPHVSGNVKPFKWHQVQQRFRLLTPQDDNSLPPARDAVATALHQSSQGATHPPSGLFAGYTPLSCRLVQLLYTSVGWKQAASALDLLWGPAVEVHQTLLQRQALAQPPRFKKPVTVVVFLGGCTYGEVGVLRALEKLLRRRFVVVTTEMLNYRSFLRSFEPTATR